VEPGGNFSALVASPENPLRLYLSQAGGVGTAYRSDDGATTWVELKNTPPDAVLSVSTEDAAAVFATVSTTNATKHVFRSTDSGQTFFDIAPLGASLVPSDVPLFAPRNANDVLAFSTEFEIYRSSNGGQAWQRSVDGLTGVWVRSVAVSAMGELMLAGSDHGDIFRSTDEGHTWVSSRDGLPSLAITALAIDPSDAGIVYAGMGAGIDSQLQLTGGSGQLYKSTDGAKTFLQLPAQHPPPSADIYAIKVDPAGTVYEREGEQVSALSTSGGLTWQPMTDVFMDVRKVPMGTTIMLSGITHAWSAPFVVSTNQGMTWQPIPDPSGTVGLDGTNAAVSSRVAPLVHYAGTVKGIARYNGSAWSLTPIFVTSPLVCEGVDFMAIGAANGHDALLASCSPGLFASIDDGQTWATVTVPSSARMISSVAVADAAGLFMLAGVEGGPSLYVTRSGGR
jgi:photosystem II stability/assembly factor-like uncharacterized protein